MNLLHFIRIWEPVRTRFGGL